MLAVFKCLFEVQRSITRAAARQKGLNSEEVEELVERRRRVALLRFVKSEGRAAAARACCAPLALRSDLVRKKTEG